MIGVYLRRKRTGFGYRKSLVQLQSPRLGRIQVGITLPAKQSSQVRLLAVPRKGSGGVGLEKISAIFVARLGL